MNAGSKAFRRLREGPLLEWAAVQERFHMCFVKPSDRQDLEVLEAKNLEEQHLQRLRQQRLPKELRNWMRSEARAHVDAERAA